MNTAAAQATQRALNDALQAAPDPLVIESNGSLAWALFEAAQRACIVNVLIAPRSDAVENLLRRADARALNRKREDKPLTGFGALS